jgi:hypothetical protein
MKKLLKNIHKLIPPSLIKGGWGIKHRKTNQKKDE